jgi:thymidylate synthase (FAD)
LVVTGNYRAWREFLDKRATSHADVEIRALAVEIGHQLQHLAPSVFGDYQDTLCPDDGTVILSRGR